MTIRHARPADHSAVSALEALCFPAPEAASPAALEWRIAIFPDSFYIAEEEGRIIGFVNGCISDQTAICDEMFSDKDFHDPAGRYQAIFGVNVHPDHRRKGVAEQLLRRMIEDTRSRKKDGLILTCKEHLVHYYAKLGFVSQGISQSTLGDAVWYDMRLDF